MTSRERFQRMYEHREADRVPVIDSPWEATIERWHKEGMPEDVSYVEFFDLDRTAQIDVDISPRYPERVLEETDEYLIKTTAYGVTLKVWKHAASVPQFLDFTVRDRDTWGDAKRRMNTDDADRIDWQYLSENYPRWVHEGRWITGGLWFGFDVTHSWTVGTERVLLALVEEPDWLRDMFETFLEINLKLLERVWDAGYRFDAVTWPDDIGYKGHTFFSQKTYRDILKPVQKRACDWAHDRGIHTHLHSCGYVEPFLPDFLEIGIEALNPLEVKAGMDPIRIKKQYGDRLVLHGGINAVLWDDMEAIRAEMERLLPVLKENGGYIFSSDHSVPSSVSLEGFRGIVNLAKQLGSYD